MKFTDAESKRVAGLVTPTESLGATGSYCGHGGIALQIAPLASRQAIDTATGKEWVTVPPHS